MTTDWGADRALYGISVAAELTGINPQMLRVYENRGLLEPHRTEGGTRRYSGRDIVGSPPEVRRGYPWSGRVQRKAEGDGQHPSGDENAAMCVPGPRSPRRTNGGDHCVATAE